MIDCSTHGRPSGRPFFSQYNMAPQQIEITMQKFIIIAAALALSLAGCGGSKEAQDLAEVEAAESAGESAMTGATAAGAPAGSTAASKPQTAMQVVVAADAIAVGNGVGPNGLVSNKQPQYGLSDTMYASLPVKGRPAGAVVKVYWTYQDGMSHKEETKNVEAGVEAVSFQFSTADGMKRGSYSVQIDVDDAPAGIVDFVVK